MPASTVVSRVDIETWAQDSRELYLFRRAVEEMQKVSNQSLMDERGYQWIAGVHGGFGGAPFCQHGNLNFLTWHRPYLLDYELKLRDQIAKFASVEEANEWRLPYWKWDTPNVKGMPKAFTDKTYDDEGTKKPNPLFQQPYMFDFPPGSPVPPGANETFRTPRPLPMLQAQRQSVLDAMKERTFSRFSDLIEGPHNMIHVWVSGFMVTFRSSFDPIFWTHHCNIDRLWWEWQGLNTDSSVPQDVRSFECQPFRFEDISAEAFFDTRKHGYTYAASRAMTTIEDAVMAADKPATKADRQVLSYQAANLQLPADRAFLHIHGLEHMEETHELRFFANRNSYPDADTSTNDRSGFLGTYAILGHGSCPGAPGHCDKDKPDVLTADNRRKHHLSPFDVSIDITAGIQRIEKARKKKAKKAKGAGPIQLYMLVLNSKGKKVRHTLVEFDNISITTHQEPK